MLYRSVYRGNKENDILLGQFARAHIASFGADELDQLERLLETPDNDIFDWVSHQRPVPPEADSKPEVEALRRVLAALSA